MTKGQSEVKRAMLEARAERTDADRMACDPFRGDRDVQIECHAVKIVTTRKEHWCALSTLGGTESHDIPAGTRVVRESAKVDGEFGTCYWCLPCVDRMLDIEAGYELGFRDDEMEYFLNSEVERKP